MNSHPDDGYPATTTSGADLSERDRLATSSVINALVSRTAAAPAGDTTSSARTGQDRGANNETTADGDWSDQDLAPGDGEDRIEETAQARSLTEMSNDLSETPDESDGALFDGDQGQLDAKLRILLVKLLKNRYLSAEDNAEEWDLLIENQDLLRSRCHDLLLDLVVDVNYGVAFKRQADSDEGTSWPTLLHDVPYTREQTAVLLFLRGVYRNHINKGESAAFVDREEMLAEVETYLPQDETQRARSSKSTLTAIDHLCRIRILLRTDSPERFRVSPIIEVILTVDVLRHLERLLMGEAIAAGAETEVPEILRTEVKTDGQLPATVEGDQLTVDGAAIPWRDTMPEDELDAPETTDTPDPESTSSQPSTSQPASVDASAGDPAGSAIAETPNAGSGAADGDGQLMAVDSAPSATLDVPVFLAATTPVGEHADKTTTAQSAPTSGVSAQNDLSTSSEPANQAGAE